MIIGFCLIMLGVLTIFSLILGTSLSGSTLDPTVDTNIIINGTTTTLEWTSGNFLFIIDPTIATIGLFVVIGALAGVLGAQALASGLSPESIKTIMICILYGPTWSLLSVLALPLISAIEIFGNFIYLSLTIAYIYGVINKISGGRE